MNRAYCLYILSNPTNTTLYIGVTNNLERRVYEHKHKLVDGFSSKYGCNKLVFYEETNDINEAILREKQIKKWKREWKAGISLDIHKVGKLSIISKIGAELTIYIFYLIILIQLYSVRRIYEHKRKNKLLGGFHLSAVVIS